MEQALMRYQQSQQLKQNEAASGGASSPLVNGAAAPNRAPPAAGQ
jgi:hypothetical protein